ncbi:hypothetical protein WMY93_018933 [Mugilogobius chulae]|uniref:Protein kinase domain-containing protein n=1 Tax=Mugilogobius chulae TaxID=88201 RepID=A0AAW0NPJ1_9GOBI
MEPRDRNKPSRQANPLDNVSQQNEEEESCDSPSEEEEAVYSTSPPFSQRQMKRMSGKHQRNCQARSGGRSPNKVEVNPSLVKESSRLVETSEEHGYKQGKKQRAALRSSERDNKKTFEGSFMLDPLSKSGPFGALSMDPRKHYLSLSSKLPVSMPHMARTHRQTSRTDCPADRLKKEKEQRGLENMAFMGHNTEVIWLELQAWHARRTTSDQDLFLFTARQAIPDIINEVLHFKVNYGSLRMVQSSDFQSSQEEFQSGSDEHELSVVEVNHIAADHWGFSTCPSMNAAEPLGSGADCREHLQRQRLAFEQVKHVMELLESVEALYPSLQALQRDYEKYAARDFQGRVQALCLWLNITQDLNQKLRVMATLLGLHDLSRIGWPVFDIPSPRCSRGNEDEENEEDEENDSTATFTAESDAEEEVTLGPVTEGDLSPSLTPKFARLLSEDEFLSPATSGSADTSGGVFCPTAIYRPFVDKALKQMGLRKLILRLHKLMDRSLQRSRAALLCHVPAQEFSDFPDSMLYSDYLPELSRTVSCSGSGLLDQVSWEDLQDMNLPSFRPAFLVLCRVLLNVIHECLKLRLEQRPAGEPSLLSIKQLVRECKEVLKGGLLMKQYYQFMLRGVVTDAQGLQTNANIDEFEEDLHKMLVVYFDYMHSWIQMLQQLPQASHSLKNLLEEEWHFTKVITPYIRGGEAQSGKLFCDIAGMLLKSTGEFLDAGLQKSSNEFWENADDSTASDEIRRSVIETSRSLKELFHEARERASKALGFAKMLRKDLEIAADFSITNGVPSLLEALKKRNYIKVLIPGLEELQVFVPCGLMEQRSMILQLLNAAAGKDCSKEPDEIPEDEAYLLMSKHGSGDSTSETEWAQWDGNSLTLVSQLETVDTLSAMTVENMLLIVMHSAHLELKNEALQLCIKISSAIDQVEYMLLQISRLRKSQTLLHCTIPQGGCSPHVGRVQTKDWRAIHSFCPQMDDYVLTKCESGRGTKPRWATQGFDFLQAIEPGFISALPEDDFLNLQALMNECIGHVIGKPHSPVTGMYIAPRNSPRPVKVPRCHSDPPNPNLFISNADGFRGSSVHENDRVSSVAAELQFKSISRHSSPTEDREEPSYPRGDPTVVRRSWELRTCIKDSTARQCPMETVRRSIRKFEEKRYAVLKQRNIIGQVCHTPKSYDNVMHVGLRKVTFKWQRGNKIGEGQYGKVYTCINVDTGELMAMKEIRFQPNDHKTIKETADELKIFEGIKHPNLVRYFGVELHREEMYIFMEYCDEGTLEEVSRLGLQEHVIRLYSKQITTAINVLHEHGIVHRDIKGANIFLTSSGLIKLGDFGCSVKLRNNTQTMPGEVNSTLGTAGTNLDL